MKPDQVVKYLRRIATGIENSKKPDKNLVARDLKQVLGRIHTAQGRILIVDNFQNVAYPYTSVEDADKKVQELLSQLNKNDQEYFRDILNLDPGVDFSEVTAAELENAEPEGIMIAHEIGGKGISMWYDTAGRETFFRAWPEEGDSATWANR